MNQQPLIQLSEGVIFLVAGISLIVVLLAGVYDLRAIASRRYLQAIVTKLRQPCQPHVTVLVYAQNDATTVEACLRSVARSRYRNYDIVVVDNVSSDMTKQVMARYRQKYPQPTMYFYGKRKVSDRLNALRQGYRKSQRGDMILVLDASATISPTLLKECVARFMADSNLKSLRLNEHSQAIQGVTLLSVHFLQLSQNIYAKAVSLLTRGYIDTGKSSVMYRSSVFKKGHGAIKVPYYYDGNLVVSITPVLSGPSLLMPSYRHKSVLLFASLLLTLVPFLLTYFFYVAATLQSSSLLMLSWLVLAIWLAVTVWSDEASKIVEKIQLTFCIPVVYFLFYLQLIVYGMMKIAQVVGLSVSTWMQSGRRLNRLTIRQP